ncbi:UBN2 domain-containing protein, partial [Cephalotus follicularis]
MWDLLEITYEGTNQVKESKINMLVHEYELFMMHNDECISGMFTHFTTIINSLKNLGKSYHNHELVRKILRCLPKKEAKDLPTLPLEKLFGSLMTHKTTMKSHEHVETKKKKSIALKALKEDSESDGDGDMALITSQFKKFLKSQKGKKTFKKKFSQDEESSKKKEPTCCECKRPATWDDSDSSSSEEESEEEVVNLALMAMEEEEEEDEVNFSFNELQDAYE